jgi:hypothetical protein
MGTRGSLVDGLTAAHASLFIPRTVRPEAKRNAIADAPSPGTSMACLLA